MYVHHPYKFEGKYYAQIEELQDLKGGQTEVEEKKAKKWKRKNKLSEILDCAFSENSDGLSVADMADETQPALDEMMPMWPEIQLYPLYP